MACLAPLISGTHPRVSRCNAESNMKAANPPHRSVGWSCCTVPRRALGVRNTAPRDSPRTVAGTSAGPGTGTGTGKGTGAGRGAGPGADKASDENILVNESTRHSVSAKGGSHPSTTISAPARPYPRSPSTSTDRETPVAFEITKEKAGAEAEAPPATSRCPFAEALQGTSTPARTAGFGGTYISTGPSSSAGTWSPPGTPTSEGAATSAGAAGSAGAASSSDAAASDEVAAPGAPASPEAPSSRARGGPGDSGAAASSRRKGAGREPESLRLSPSRAERRVSNVLEGRDPHALVKALLPIEALVGGGALLASLLSAFFPPQVPLLLASAMLLPTVGCAALKAMRVIPNPEAERVMRGHVTDNLKGEFCVFLLGTRTNGIWKLTPEAKELGDNFARMILELESLPAEAGFLGGDSYVSSNVERGSHVMVVTYWRSYEHLMQYSWDRGLVHAPAMQRLMAAIASLPDLGIWHEAYIVKPGQHESIYVNCPPLGLGAASSLVPAAGKLKSSRGRVRASSTPPEAAEFAGPSLIFL